MSTCPPYSHSQGCGNPTTQNFSHIVEVGESVSEQVKYKNVFYVHCILANKQVTGIGFNECPRQSPSKSKTKATTNDVARATSSKATCDPTSRFMYDINVQSEYRKQHCSAC